jgi:hypothetical protein
VLQVREVRLLPVPQRSPVVRQGAAKVAGTLHVPFAISLEFRL